MPEPCSPRNPGQVCHSPSLRLGPEFISTSLTGAQSRPRGPHPGSSILTRPPHFSSFPFPLSSCQLGFYRYAYRFFISLSPGLCLGLCLWVFLHPSPSGFALPSFLRPAPCPILSNPRARVWRSALPLADSKLPPPTAVSAFPAPAGPLHSHKVWLWHCRGRGRPGPAQLCPRPARPRPRPLDNPLSDSSSRFKSLGPACRTAPLASPARPVCSSVPLPRDSSEQSPHL